MKQMFCQLLHIMDLQMVDPLLKDTPDAVVHRIEIWQTGWPHLWTRGGSKRGGGREAAPPSEISGPPVAPQKSSR